MPFDHEAATPTAARPPGVVSAERAAGPAARPLHAATPASLLRLQRLAGNAAVQRQVTIDELDVSAAPPAGAAGTTGTTAGGSTLGDGTSPVAINGPVVDVNAPAVNLHSAVVNADGILRANTIIAENVIGTNYTPGAGNVM